MNDPHQRLTQEVVEIIADVADVPIDRVTTTTTLEELKFDSLTMVEAAVTIKDRLDVDLSDEVVKNVVTVQDVVDTIEQAMISA